MLKLDKKLLLLLFFILYLCSVAVIFVDWKVDNFDFFKVQNYELYFQSWVSMAGVLFTIVMTISTFFIYKKSKIASLKFISLSFLMTSFAYAIIAYHTSYCKMCSDLTMCGASHNYSNYFTVIALVITVLTILLINLKNNITPLKQFAYALVIGSSLLLVTLFISIEFMETPDIIAYAISNINIQGLSFIFPLVLIVLSFVYFRKMYKDNKVILFIFALLFVSFLPQAYHVFVCTECHNMECSEFFVASGLMMFIATALLIYAIGLQFEEKKNLK